MIKITPIAMTLKTLTAGFLGGCMLAALSVSTNAQQAINSVEVLVNDEPITSFEINQRLRLVVALSGGIKSEAEFLKLRENVITSMIDERLKLQEARELEVEISDEESESFFTRQAQGVGQSPEQFANALRQIGSSKQTMKIQLTAGYVWSQIVQGRMGAFVSVSDEEVEAQIQRIYDNKGKFEYNLAEIVLEVNNREQEASVEASAKRLIEQIKAGSSFPELAQQLSSSSTATIGGDLGWMSADDLSPEQAKIVENLAVGSVSDAIRTPGGYLILALRDRRRILIADPLDMQMALRQLFLTKAQTEDAATVSKFSDYVADLKTRNDISCGQIQQYATEAGADANTEIGVLRLRDLDTNLRSHVVDIEIGKPSDIVQLEDGWRVLFVCDRQEAQVQEPDFDTIYNQIESVRLAMMDRRYLRDLRRNAIIDYR